MWEGWSLALAEAVMTGIPVVATRVGAASAFEAFESVHLIDPPFDAIEALNPDTIRSLAWHDDSAFVERLAKAMTEAVGTTPSGSSPREHAELFSNDRVHASYLQMYHWLVQGGSLRALRRLTADRASLA
jgi:hypothetical protein